MITDESIYSITSKITTTEYLVCPVFLSISARIMKIKSIVALLGIVGSIASIVGLGYAWITSDSSSVKVDTTQNAVSNSPVLGNVGGDVSIVYGSPGTEQPAGSHSGSNRNKTIDASDLVMGTPRERIKELYGTALFRKSIPVGHYYRVFEDSGEFQEEDYRVGDLVLRALYDKSDSMVDYCVTVLSNSASFETVDGVVLGFTSFSQIPIYEGPSIEFVQGNKGGWYRYEESGFIPGVEGFSSYMSYAFHAITTLVETRDLKDRFIPVQEGDAYKMINMRIRDDWKNPNSWEDGTLKLEAVFFDGNSVTGRPATAVEQFNEFRCWIRPDTVCSGGAVEFRNTEPLTARLGLNPGVSLLAQ